MPGPGSRAGNGRLTLFKLRRLKPSVTIMVRQGAQRGASRVHAIVRRLGRH